METTNNEEFCRQVISGVSDRIALELVTKVLGKERAPPNWERESAAFALLTRGKKNFKDCCKKTLT